MSTAGKIKYFGIVYSIYDEEAVEESILNEDDIKIIKDIKDDELLKNEAEISFYVYTGYKIIYTDENGCIYPVEICL